MPSTWSIQENTYNETLGFDFFTLSSGYVEVQSPTTQESVSLPFLWFFSSRFFYYGYSFNFWDEYPNSSLWLDDLQLFRFEQTTNSNGNFYYLVLPETEPGIFQNISDTTTSENLFAVNQIDEAFKSILVEPKQDFNLTTLPLPARLDVCDVTNCYPQSVPEASSVMGVLAIGLTVVGVAIKRTFFSKR